jgi:rhodanese-related sulfurtransferase
MAVPRLTKEELKRRLDDPGGARPVLLDVRLKYPFEHSTMTLPGAIRMAPGSVDPSTLPHDRDIVVYDSDPEELVAERIAAELIRRGYRAFALEGGIGAWAVAKLPTDRKPAPEPAAPVTGASKG